MHHAENSFEFEGLLCFPRKSAPPSYYYVPLHADLDRGENGRPLFNLIALGTTGYLMFSAVWRARDQALEVLRTELARRHDIADPSTIQLAPAPIDSVRCDLLLGDGSEQFEVIATSATSGMAPYAALFNLALTEGQFAAVAAAVNGTPNRLAVEYDVSLITPVTVSARLIPQSPRLIPWLREYLTGGAVGFRAALQEALEEGLAAIQLDLPEQLPGELLSTLYERVLTRATELLPQLIEATAAAATTSFEVAVSLVEELRQPFHPRVDLAELGLAQNQIMVAGSTAGEVGRKQEQAAPLCVKLGSDLGDAPLAWIRLQIGGAQTVLKPPRFEPATIQAHETTQPLRVTTAYTDGTPAFKKELAPAGEKAITLRAHDLGLVMVVVDARPLAEAGVRSAQIWLSYNPPHRQSVQRHSLQLGADAWVAHVWLATPSPASLRYLDYHWRAVCADGRLVDQSAVYSGSSDIVLSL